MGGMELEKKAIHPLCPLLFTASLYITIPDIYVVGMQVCWCIAA